MKLNQTKTKWKSDTRLQNGDQNTNFKLALQNFPRKNKQTNKQNKKQKQTKNKQTKTKTKKKQKQKTKPK